MEFAPAKPAPEVLIVPMKPEEVQRGSCEDCGFRVVVDHGSGISPVDAPHLFERFVRGERRTSGGHGLGLAICQSIMHGHGGYVVQRPTPGGGATFEVRWPRAGANPPAPR